MVQLIVGKKGKGKTKQLLDKVNSEIKEISGNIAYLDKSKKHMFELNNKVRLIDISQFMIESSNEFIGVKFQSRGEHAPIGRRSRNGTGIHQRHRRHLAAARFRAFPVGEIPGGMANA